jgi:hypothetical protein
MGFVGVRERQCPNRTWRSELSNLNGRLIIRLLTCRDRQMAWRPMIQPRRGGRAAEGAGLESGAQAGRLHKYIFYGYLRAPFPRTGQ